MITFGIYLPDHSVCICFLFQNWDYDADAFNNLFITFFYNQQYFLLTSNISWPSLHVNDNQNM